MLVGRYNQNIDAKGRVNIPSKFRSYLGETFVVAAAGDEKCVSIYPLDEWNAFMERVSALDSEVRTMMMRYIQNTSAECDLDSQGRVVIPPEIRAHAELSKEIVVVGEQKKIEVWNKDNWDAYRNDKFDMVKIADVMKEIGI